MKQLLHVPNIILGAVGDDGDYAGDNADDNYNGDANCDRPVAGILETFKVEDKGNGKFAFKSHHGKYLVAESNGALNADRDKALAYETFEVVAEGK